MSTSSVVVVLGAVGVISLGACDGAKPPPPPPPPAQVGFVVVEKRDIALYIEAVGTLDGYVNADIRARVRGYLEKQNYQDGSPVAAGQVLFTIEPTEYQASAKSANANLARARVGLAKNKLDRDRDQDLVKAGMASRQDLDNASAAVADSEAQVSAAEAQLQQAGLNLGYTTIRSPIAGVAGLALVRVGNLVGQDGPTLLTTVSQLDPVRVNFPLSEVDYVRYPERFAHLEGRDLAWARQEFTRLDQQPELAGVEIVLADGRLYPHRGAIVAVNRQIDATGTTQLQALVPNPDGVLRPGEYARVRIRRENEGKGVVLVPEKALVAVQGSYSVAEIGADNKVTMRRIELGAGTPGFRVVTTGLSGGEHIVVDGLQRVTDGAVVAPHPAPPPPATPPAAGSAAPPGAGSAAPPAAGSAAPAGQTAAAPAASSTRAN
ncbi:MAG TPA: efflux RND transporter periplasmic adaptor subunit [Kofleriaceae bacterium]|jgi:membrane fusion protein (multidrug efflux system)|nr:efflux RND transporter periplasmic adaptor subunit [Kofleriaceae bacterium]